eukprot:EG_transcript_4368
MSATLRNGSLYNTVRLKWPSSTSNSPTAQQSMRQRCLSESPDTEVVGVNCPDPFCGADPRLTSRYQAYAGTGYSFISNVQAEPFGTATLHTTLPLSGGTAATPSLLGVADASAPLTQTPAWLPTLLSLFGQPAVALLLNDANLTVLGSTASVCADDEPVPGDPSLPVFSCFRSCDPGLRAVAEWLATNQPLSQSSNLEVSGTVWNIAPVQTAVASYFFIMGITRDTLSLFSLSGKLFADYIPILRAQLLRGLAQDAESTRAYTADLGAQNIQTTQDMQDRFVEEINALLNSSRTSLAAMEEQGSANARAISDAQVAAANARKAEALTAMAVTTGWTVAVVVAILLAVLGASAWGTTQVANALNHIIRLMEDVADMKVENLTVPQGHRLREVARIQSAFRVPAGGVQELHPHGGVRAAADV